MIKDSDLKKRTDYSKGQKDAAYMVLGDLVNILEPYAEDMRVIGGWVPSLLYPEAGHIGSIDVDLLLNQQKIKNESYETIKKILLRNGYHKHEEKFFSFVKPVEIEGIHYEVDVDFLSGKYGGNSGAVSKHVGGIKALPATGGNLAFDFPAQEVSISYSRIDGAKDIGHVKVIAMIPFLIMKTAALGRGKPKDAYDIYFCINNYSGGVRSLVEEMTPFRERELMQRMCKKLYEKFMSPDHAGPMDIVAFLDLNDKEEIERIKQDAYQKINFIIDNIMT